MTRHADAIGRAYERLARARKVAKMLAKLPLLPLDPTGERTIAVLEQATSANRAQFASWAGVTVPSDQTWRELIEAVRARMQPANDRDPANHITRGG